MKKNLRILVTGFKGQLGYDCVRELNERGYRFVKGIDINDVDITKEEAIKEYIYTYKPNVIIHCAAWTSVDKAEELEEEVYKINALGSKYIAEACKEIDAKMIYISTDYVFDGCGSNEFEVDSPKNGLSVYGKTKSQGEDFVSSILEKYFIVRISWVFGLNGNNFVKTMINLSKKLNEINVVCDQIGSITYTYDLSKLLCDMIETEDYGFYHATNEGIISWYDFACEIFKQLKINVKVNPITTEEYSKQKKSAKRPLNSRLSKNSLDLNFYRLPHWKDALTRYLKELKENE